MSYFRVLPRDLFNEANLLKCLGQLALIAHDRGRPDQISVITSGGAFNIAQREEDGSIYCANVQIIIRNRRFEHRRPLNSREPWPLWLWPAFDHPALPEGWGDEIEAFAEDGSLSPDLARLIDGADPTYKCDCPLGVCLPAALTNGGVCRRSLPPAARKGAEADECPRCRNSGHIAEGPLKGQSPCDQCGKEGRP